MAKKVLPKKAKVKFRAITDGEMALPGKQITEEQFDEWNNRSDERPTISTDELRCQLNAMFCCS